MSTMPHAHRWARTGARDDPPPPPRRLRRLGRVDRSSDPWSAVAAGGLSAQELPPAGVGVPRRHRWDAVTLERLAVRLASSSKLDGMGAQTGAVGGGDQ